MLIETATKHTLAFPAPFFEPSDQIIRKSAGFRDGFRGLVVTDMSTASIKVLVAQTAQSLVVIDAIYLDSQGISQGL